jgi:hypothetical protein
MKNKSINKSYSTYFSTLKIGEKFHQNGYSYVKKSNKKAINLNSLYNYRLWNFEKNEIINVIAKSMAHAVSKLIKK